MNPFWCNGQWLNTVDFPVSPTDRGLLLGLGLFETILALDGEPVFAGRHLARLRAGCHRLGWHPAHADLHGIMRELITRRNLTTGRARIRLAISAGSGTLRDLAPGADHVIWMTASKAAAPPPAISADLSPWVRNERSPLAGLKCASYAENALALAHAASLGFEETILTNTTGRLCEAATANLFLVRSGGLLTPSLASGCLPGITRGVVLGLAGQLGIPSAETDLYPADLWTADEVFLTSSTGGLMEVSRLAGRTMAPAPLTAALRSAWHAATRGNIRT